MRKSFSALLLCSVVAVSANVLAACEQPDDPFIPDGATASGADMINAKKAVTVYLSAAQLYLSCGIPAEMQKDVSDHMDTVIEKFNNSLVAYSKVPNAAVRFGANALARR